MIPWMLLLAFTAQVGVPVVTIARGTNSGIADAKEVAIRTASEWEELWKAHAGQGSRPAVDFSTEMVAAIFLGTRPTGGFRAEIIGTRHEADVLIVEYVERLPGAGAIVTQAQTFPFHIAKLAKHDGPVRFEESTSVGR
jgi:hypothetical protein